ncbi:MAG: hypothetical protein ACE5MM_04460, partial [Nitrospiraceae bacterium]
RRATLILSRYEDQLGDASGGENHSPGGRKGQGKIDGAKGGGMMVRPAKGNTPSARNKRRRTLKRSQLRQARKEAERQRKQVRADHGGGAGQGEAQRPW